MGRFEQSFAVNRNIKDVWKFYTDIHHLLIITPPSVKINVDPQIPITSGVEFRLSGKLFTRSRWKARITHCEPFQYIDEMLEGPFKIWKHVHRFEAIGNNQTEVIDIIEYELPFGVFGKFLERIYVQNKISEMFDYRRKATINALK